jgi:hypothetical protein
MERYAIRKGQIIVVPHARELEKNVQRIGEALAEVIAHGGEDASDDQFRTVHDQARDDPNHPLHRHLEWDDAKCGYIVRLSQIKSIVRVIRVETDSGDLKRAFVSVRNEEDGRSYRTLQDVVSSGTLQRSLLADAERDLTAWLRRYGELVEVAEMAGLVEEARAGIAELMRRQTTPESETSPA